MPTTTRFAKASSRASNASSSTAALSSPTPTRGWPSSSTSKAGTTRGAVTPRSTTNRRSTTKSCTWRRLDPRSCPGSTKRGQLQRERNQFTDVQDRLAALLARPAPLQDHAELKQWLQQHGGLAE